MYSEISNYPETVDDLIFYQDADINKQKNIVEYNQNIENGNYESAYTIRDENNLHGINAELINMFINRVKTLQEHIKTKTKQEKVFFETDRPTNVSHGTIWISKRENEV